jgi:hypothetical protein
VAVAVAVAAAVAVAVAVATAVAVLKLLRLMFHRASFHGEMNRGALLDRV